MSEPDQETPSRDISTGGHMRIGMYEAGGVDGSDFHVFNLAPDHYHRQEALQRTGAIDVSCKLEKVVHGAISPESDRYATLLIMHWLFQPKGSRRISEATIKLLFEATSSSSDIEVEDISYNNTYSLMETTQEETITKGGSGTVGFQQLAHIEATGKWEKVISTTTSKAITLSGGKKVVNNIPPNRIATWTISENQSQPNGIPASLKVAVLISRDDEEKFFCRLSCICKTDLKTAAETLFKKIPKDDPIIFQPDPQERGTRPNKNVSYGDENLGAVKLNGLCDVTYRTVIKNGQKTWE